MGTLPVELTDRIIDDNHTDPETLRNCALVHRSWTSRSFHHLFRHLLLILTAPDSTFLALDTAAHPLNVNLQTFQSLKNIHRHVRQLTIRGPDARVLSEYTARGSTAPSEGSPVHITMCNIREYLAMLPNVASLSIHSLQLRDCEHDDPQNCIPYEKSHPFTLLSLANINHVGRYTNILNCCSFASSIDVLHLADLRSDFAPQSLYQKQSIKHYVFDRAGGLMGHLSQDNIPEPIPGDLTTLSMERMDRPDLETMQQFMRRFGESLTVLHIAFSRDITSKHKRVKRDLPD